MQASSERKVLSLSEAEIEVTFPLLRAFALTEFRERTGRISDRWQTEVMSEVRRVKSAWVSIKENKESSFVVALAQASDVAKNTNLFRKNASSDKHRLLEIMLLIGYDIGKEDRLVDVQNLIFTRLENLNLLTSWKNPEELSRRTDAILAILLIGNGYNPISRMPDDLGKFESFVNGEEFGHTREKTSE